MTTTGKNGLQHHHYQSERRLVRHTIHTIFTVLPILSILTFSVLLSACNKDDKYQFTTSRSAVETYRAFLSKIKSVRTSNTKEYVASLKEWKEVNDTVYKFLVADSAFVKYHNEANDYFLIRDSIRKELLRLAETWRYGYDDVLSIKEQTSTYKDDGDLVEAVSLATPFFASLDSTGISVCDKASILKRYRYFLTTTLCRGVNSREDMLRFIRDEDYMFRTFLHHLYEMDDEPLADISRNTEAICRNIFIAAREGRIPSKDAIVYMSMRTVRRLLQNSAECVENINRLEMKGKAQGNAYLWMIIQPFVSIDPFLLATMTPQERSRFEYIVNQLPKSRRFADTFDINLSALNYLLPQQLLKIYVLSV